MGLGTNRLTGTPADRAFLEAAVNAGLDFIDTAHLYTDGQSESAIGSALEGAGRRVVVATKGGYHGGGNGTLRAELEESLRRLRTETIDLYYLHRVDPVVPIEESMGLLEEYRDAGRIAHIGVSEVSVEQIERARSVVPVAAVQNEYSLSERMHESVVDHCDAEGILFVPFYPLDGPATPALAQLAETHRVTPSQIKLAWLVSRSPVVVPIPGTRSLEHLRENLAALDIYLTAEELESLGR